MICQLTMTLTMGNIKIIEKHIGHSFTHTNVVLRCILDYQNIAISTSIKVSNIFIYFTKKDEKKRLFFPPYKCDTLQNRVD